MALEIKICGLSTPETLEAALGAGADMVGMVFFPPSPRHVDLATAQTLAARARGRARIVALTVDADDATLAAIVAAVRPDLLQLHGTESPERLAILRARFGVPVMKAVGIAMPADLDRLAAYDGRADRLLLDAKPPKGAVLPGGNGVPFDWNLIAGRAFAAPFLLGGGLDPANVGAAVRLIRPDGVDVSSGVERAPGIKDPDRIAAFVRAARAADTAATAPARPADTSPARETSLS
ncbi:phosphoribosylanthranilate isomerase [Ancylobacter amanitiformis]|uniref:N-(5'-phosphoribosyl)anthranilate isomerase n=1 Tax=Ancylobacter amanitiformis TaxID=217069 RepID=A0ABU0LQV8_9HYPH|nr:phosphoribosylanthranilate isomerase [Ancylobacter amanitiformis]MDQ0511090.1 phosphoribosylanthranilate isomerase [Ancylobacter amanitiformis]